MLEVQGSAGRLDMVAGGPGSASRLDMVAGGPLTCLLVELFFVVGEVVWFLQASGGQNHSTSLR